LCEVERLSPGGEGALKHDAVSPETATPEPSHGQGFDGSARGGEEQVVLVPEASVDL
jgi:hypothetical protein